MKTLPAKNSPGILNRKMLLSGLLMTGIASQGAASRAIPAMDAIPAGIVDMHCHIAGIGAGGSGCFISPRMRHNWRFNIYLHSFGVSRRELERQGDHLVADRISASLAGSQFVSHAVILAMDGVIGPDGQLDTHRTEVYVPNEFVAAMAAQHTNLLFGASVNPLRPDALERLTWAKAHGAVLVKWLPSIMEFDPSDPRFIPFYKKLEELNLPLLSHTGPEHSFSKSDEALGDPETLRLPLSLGVTVIAAHVAASGKYHGERGADRLARMMLEFPNLYADISALTLINNLGYLHRAVHRPEFAGRLVYGSDFPLIRTPLVSPWYSVRIPFREKFAIARHRNPWDRDVLMKRDLGAAPEIFGKWGNGLGRRREREGICNFQWPIGN